MKVFAYALVALGLLVGSPLAMADEVKTERVHFERGKTGATISGRIKGYDTMHYLLGAQAGQTMSVTLHTKSTSTYFNIFTPGKMPGQDEAMFIGDTGGDQFEGVLPQDGDYLIQVYLYRNAARKGETAKFTLDLSIGAAASTGDALVPGTDFNATGNIPCARDAGQPMAQCEFGVKREGNGNGSITVFWPDGGNRVIFFEMNTPSSYDQSEADGGAEMTVDEDNGIFTVRIGGQRFEIFDAIMAGG
jgi:hypothetical protein